jgi:hypothetical protein
MPSNRHRIDSTAPIESRNEAAKCIDFPPALPYIGISINSTEVECFNGLEHDVAIMAFSHELYEIDRLPK